MKENQYEGVKGCGTSHLLIGVWDEVIRGLEDNRESVMLTKTSTGLVSRDVWKHSPVKG